ncbi:hypothetical protein HY029_06000 [Candidatus Gottesmanbacteria bacterium]|nr:hypothetical protein [Candidatus Gottesmanbacteria bacterium]
MTKQKGQTIVEFLIAIGLASIFLPALLTGLVASREGKAQQTQRLEATTYLKEAEEAIRSVRETNWSSIAVNGTYHPVISGNTWSLGSNSEVVNGYTRKIVISDTQIGTNGNIVSTGGTIDPATKKIVSTVSWNTPFSSSVDSTMYLTRFLKNANVLQTTQADFNQSGSVNNNTVITNNSGGEITLTAAGPGRGDWCKPQNEVVNTLDLPGQGITTAISAIYGHAYTTTGGNASGDSMDSVNISDPPQPIAPAAANAGAYNYFKTYAIYATPNYVYLTSDHPNLTVDIVNPTTLSHAGYFNSSGGERPGNSVYVSGNTGYVAAGSKLYAFDVTTILGSSSQTELWNVNLAGTGKKVLIYGNYLFVATDSTTSQLQIINISTHAITNVNLGNNLAGIDLDIDPTGSYLFIVTAYASGKSNFYIVDISNPTSPQSINSSNTNGMTPKGVINVLNGNRAVIVGTGGTLYQVFNTQIKTNISLCGQTSPTGVTGLNAISSVLEPDTDAFSYILTDNASAELQIIEGGPGGTFALSGTYQSAVLSDPGTDVAFNRLFATVSQPSNTSIKFQIAISEPVNGSCSNATYTFFGPSATNPYVPDPNAYFTSSTYNTSPFSVSWPIPFTSNQNGFSNPGRCVKYKAYFSTSSPTVAPTLYDITFNYSP